MFKIEKENSNIERFVQVGTLLKGVWHEIYFFHESVSPGPLSVITVGPFQISKIRSYIRERMFISSVGDTGG